MWLLDMCCLLRLQSARAELEEQLSVAIEDAKELATEAVSRQRRAVAQATAAEKALFARGELQMLAEAVAGKWARITRTAVDMPPIIPRAITLKHNGGVARVPDYSDFVLMRTVWLLHSSMWWGRW